MSHSPRGARRPRQPAPLRRTVDEVVLMVRIQSHVAEVTACESADADESGEVDLEEVIAAIENALAS